MVRSSIHSFLSWSLCLAALACEVEDDAEFAQRDELLTDEDTSAGASRAPHSAPPRAAPGEIIVKFSDPDGARRAGLTPAGVRLMHRDRLSAGAELWELDPEERRSASGPDEVERRTLMAIEALLSRPDVEYAHENLYFRYFAAPNDSHYPKQWNLPAIKLPAAWARTTGGVKIALLDSGRVDHPDLVGRWGTGYDFAYGDADPRDDSDWHHGLHVAGILGARTNNGTGVAGATWSGSILPVRIGKNNGYLAMSAVGDAVKWSADQGARVINMSFGTAADSNCSSYPFIQNAINYAVQKGVVVVAAAGNDNANTGAVVPASCTGVIAVAASTSTGARAPWSNKGSRVDITAPGGTVSNNLYGAGVGCTGEPNLADPYSGTDGVFSTWAVGKPAGTLSGSNYCYRYLSGTSMAAPHVAAAAALMLSINPAMTPAGVTARLKSTAKPIAGCGVDCGAGLLDVSAALPVVPPPDDPCGPCSPGKDCHCGDICRPINTFCP